MHSERVTRGAFLAWFRLVLPLTSLPHPPGGSNNIFLLFCKEHKVMGTMDSVLLLQRLYHKTVVAHSGALSNGSEPSFTSHNCYKRNGIKPSPFTESEFMNVQFRWGIILRVLRLEVSVYNVYITNQPLLLKAGGGGGIKSVSRGDGE